MKSTHPIQLLRLSRAQCRAVDGYAIETLGIPGTVLMENAGRQSADLVERYLKTRVRAGSGAGVSVVCGKGNNGGDGFVIARHLALRGYKVNVDLWADPAELRGEAAINCVIAEKMGLPVRRLTDQRSLAAACRRWRAGAVVVDALLGTGFAGQVREPLAEIIARINDLNGPAIVAVDIPSGLDCDSGTPGGIAVQADATITFLAEKIGFAQRGARTFTGKVTAADIGAPLDLILKHLGIRGQS